MDLESLKVQLTSVAGKLVLAVSWELIWACEPGPSIPLYLGFSMDAWASSHSGGWVPRMSVPKEPEGNHSAFYDLLSEVTASFFGQPC